MGIANKDNVFVAEAGQELVDDEWTLSDASTVGPDQSRCPGAIVARLTAHVFAWNIYDALQHVARAGLIHRRGVEVECAVDLVRLTLNPHAAFCEGANGAGATATWFQHVAHGVNRDSGD